MSGDDNESFEAGRAVVREVLVNRLAAAGLKPRKGVTPAAHGKCMDHLVGHLAYMAPDNLVTLAETILTHASASGPDFGLWPSELTIRNWAEALQSKPFRLHPIVTSWLRSREGPAAVAGGYLVELMRWLRRHRRAVMPYDLGQIKAEAADNQRAMAAARERVAVGRPNPGDHDMLSAWQRDMAEALQYVDEGITRRAAGSANGQEVAA